MAEKAAFLVLLSFGAAYFLLRRRTFDLAALAFFSSSIYFIPGLFGFDFEGHPLRAETYLVFCAVLAATLLYGVLQDLNPYSLRPVGIPPADTEALYVCVALAVVAIASISIITGVSELVRPKLERDVGPLQSVLWRVPASLLFVAAFVLRSRWALTLGTLFLVLLFLASDRTGPGMAIIAAIAVTAINQGRSRWLFRNIVWLPPIVFMALVFFYAKPFQAAVIAVNSGFSAYDALRQAVEVGPYDLFVRTEPFGTQMVLNRVVETGFRVDPSYLGSAIAQILPTPSSFGFSSNAFNDLYQPRLFTGYQEHSLGYNFWAEALAAGGWTLFAGYLALYVCGLALLNWLLRSRDAFLAATALLMGSYWAFYTHRNSLFSILAYERQIAYVAAACYVCGLLARTVISAGLARDKSPSVPH